MNLNINECDDGNVMDGDGCSGNCAVEAGFICFDGNSTNPDTCIDVVPPYPRSADIDSTFNVNITFIEPVLFARQPSVSDLAI